MKKIYAVILLCLTGIVSQAQVTQIYTDYNTFWQSNSTTVNTVKPNLSHNLLAFKYNGTLFSTGVNNAKLNSNGVTVYQNTKFRALPITSVPLTSTGSSYFIGFGALVDGIANSVDNNTASNNPFVPVTTGAQKAAYLTDGIQGLNLGTCLTNIPVSGGTLTFNLSTNGITIANVNDSAPDILVSQIAQPDSTFDELYFVGADGTTVIGNKVLIKLNDNAVYPVVANWNVDFYNNNKTQTDAAFINTERPIRFFATDIHAFGITVSNYTLAKKLIYKPGGTSDPAFIAFNEPSIGVATQLKITAQPTTSDCQGNMPTSFTVRLTDSFGDIVEQAGYEITAAMYSGPGLLLGTITATTNAAGIATFNALQFEVGGNHVIQFESTSLQPVQSTQIVGPNCADNTWTGDVSTAWSTAGNWSGNFVPNANNNVTIPAGRLRYPLLTANAGAANLTMGLGTSIRINARLFTIKGTITKALTAYIDASVNNSELYMSGTVAQTIPSGLILNNDISNFTVDNPAGVITNDILLIKNLLKVNSGNFETNGLVTLACTFTPHKTGQVAAIGGTISGNVIAEQCFPARRAFRFISSSVTTTTSIRNNWQEMQAITGWNLNPKPGYGTHITGLTASGTIPSLTDGTNGYDWQPSGNTSMFTFNNATQAWAPIGNTNVNTLVAGRPYRLLIRGSRSINIQLNSTPPTDTKLRSTGTVVKGPVAVAGLNAAPGAYNFVGNPFHAIVDMKLVMGAASNLTNFYYVWDPTLGGNPIVGQAGGRGAYVAVNASTGTKNNASSAVTRYLQPYQAFFVQTANLGATPQLIFRETDKTTTAAHTNVFRLSGHPYIDLSLYSQAAYLGESTSSDGLRIDFISDGNNDVDADDALKFANSDENVSRLNGDKEISIESRLTPVAGEELPLSITQYRETNYVLKLELGHFEGLDAFLKDNFTNQQTPLNDDAETAINFTVDATNTASTSANRFSVLFTTAVMGTGDAGDNNSFSLYPNPVSGGELYINASSFTNDADVTVYNTLGQKVLEVKAGFGANSQMAIPVSTLETGIYVLKMKAANGTVYSAKFVKK